MSEKTNKQHHLPSKRTAVENVIHDDITLYKKKDKKNIKKSFEIEREEERIAVRKKSDFRFIIGCRVSKMKFLFCPPQ